MDEFLKGMCVMKEPKGGRWNVTHVANVLGPDGPGRLRDTLNGLQKDGYVLHKLETVVSVTGVVHAVLITWWRRSVAPETTTGVEENANATSVGLADASEIHPDARNCGNSQPTKPRATKKTTAKKTATKKKAGRLRM